MPSLGALGRFTLAIVLVVSSGATAGLAPRWEKTNAAGREQGIVIAVCLPVSEIVCVGVGCRDQNGFDFVEMIVGDWLHGPTRLSAGAYTTTTTMGADERASSALNLPVSRGPIDRTFLARLARHGSLRVEALESGYSATFPLAGFRRARHVLTRICVGARATS
jgi:hypothetical protein